MEHALLVELLHKTGRARVFVNCPLHYRCLLSTISGKPHLSVPPEFVLTVLLTYGTPERHEAMQQPLKLSPASIHKPAILPSLGT